MVTNVLWRNDVTISITLSHRIGSNKKQSNADNKLLQTTIQNSVTYKTTFVDSINVFDCRPSSVFLIY